MAEPASSYYLATATPLPAHTLLKGRREAAVCVIGGGFAGLNAALGLAERGVTDVVLLEARTPGFGASGRNGGFVFGGFSRGEDALLRELGPVRAKLIKKGMIFSPAHGDIAFTVPLFDEFMVRAIPAFKP